LVGELLNGRFELLEVVGGGATGEVYRALDRILRREVAVKVLTRRFDAHQDPTHRQRFRNEAALTARLVHPNIVTVFDRGETDSGLSYIAMELLKGRTLHDALQAEGPLHFRRAIELTGQICRALREAHQLGLVHRDLKPANLFLVERDDTQWVKVLDFGLAKPFDRSAQGDLTEAGALLGSPTYMAPEQSRNQASPQSDIYSLGVVLFLMLTGRVPFTAKSTFEVILQHLQTPVPWFREVRPGLELPAGLEGVVRRCLEKEPHRRFASMAELLQALQAAAGQQPSSSVGPQPRRWELRAALGLALLGGFGWLQFGRAPVETAPPSALPIPPVQLAAGSASEPVEPDGPVRFKINTIPAGATLKVSGKRVGTTPASFEASPDADGLATANISIELEGFQSLSFTTGGYGPEVVMVQRLQPGNRHLELPPQLPAPRVRRARLTPATLPPVDPASTSGPMAAAAETPAPSPVITRPAEALVSEVPPPGLLAPVSVLPVEPMASRAEPLSALMKRPELIDPGQPVVFTREALISRSEGTGIAKCVVTLQGTLDNCRLIKSVPFLDQAMLTSLKTRRYKPAELDGKPIEAEMAITVKLALKR
jgi:serine/threonine-protein kinase